VHILLLGIDFATLGDAPLKASTRSARGFTGWVATVALGTLTTMQAAAGHSCVRSARPDYATFLAT